jgi:hypothetical protein
MDKIFAFVLIFSAAYLTWRLFSNDRATELLQDKSKSLDEFLAGFNASLHAVGFYDCSPCEVRFSVLPLGHAPARFGLPSSAVWHILHDNKENPAQIEALIRKCVQMEASFCATEAKNKSF